jgi:hypothetical protein
MRNEIVQPDHETSRNTSDLKLRFFVLALLLFSCTAFGSTDPGPTAADINSLAAAAKATVDAFMHDTRQLRFRYEYAGDLSNKRDREMLQALAREACAQLDTIAASQKKLRQQIEDYRGQDWEARYGSTGLWRKLAGDIYRTNLSRCEIELHLARASDQPETDKILHKIRTEIEALDQSFGGTIYSQFLKANTLALIAQSDAAYEAFARREFDTLRERSDMPQSTAFRIEIERMKLTGQTDRDHLIALAENIAQSKCAGDTELVLSVASLQHRSHELEAFEKTLKLFPQIAAPLGSLILSDLSERLAQGQLTARTLRQISTLEAELAALAAWRSGPGDHADLLDLLANTESFRTPLITYVAAMALAQSSPAKAVNLLVTAGSLQQQRRNDRLQTPAQDIAKQAAQLAYNILTRDPQNCEIALEAFENYRHVAGDRIDDELEYLHSIVLNSCGQDKRAARLLQEIASRPGAKWRNRARFDLIVQAIQQDLFSNQQQRNELARQLGVVIADCRGENEIDKHVRAEAMTLYCRLLLETEDTDSARKVLKVLTEADIRADPSLNAFKSRALRRLGRLEEAAESLLLAIDPNNKEHAIEAMELLSDITDHIDQLEQQANDFRGLVENCLRLAQYCETIALSTFGLIPVRQARLHLVELSIFAASRDQEKLFQAEKLLTDMTKGAQDQDVDTLRCRARLRTEQSQFGEAARLWAQIAEMRRSETSQAPGRTQKWWRAKYYELYCWAKLSQTRKEDILHAIEVLENSFTDIPPLWAGKLLVLKQNCSYTKETRDVER